MDIDFLTGFAHELGAAKAAERAEVRKREDAELERRRGILDDLWKGVTEGRVNPRFYAQAVKDSLSIGDAQVKGGKRGKRQDPLTPFLDMLTSMPEEPQAAAAPAQGAQGAGPFNPPRFINPNELFITQPPETKAQMLSRATALFDRLPADYDVRQSPYTERLLRESGLPLVERTVGGERRLTRPETAEESRLRETRDAMVQQLTTILRRPDLPTEDRAVLSAELARVRAGGPLPSMEQLRLTLEPKRAPAASASDLDWADRATAALKRRITPEMRGTLTSEELRAMDQYERSMRGVERSTPSTGVPVPPSSDVVMPGDPKTVELLDLSIAALQDISPKAKGYGSAVGFGVNQIPFASDEMIAGTAAGDFRTRFKNFEALQVLPKLSFMKGLGQMSNMEFDNMRNAAAALKTNLSEAEYARQWAIMDENLRKARNRAMFGTNYINDPDGDGRMGAEHSQQLDFDVDLSQPRQARPPGREFMMRSSGGGQ